MAAECGNRSAHYERPQARKDHEVASKPRNPRINRGSKQRWQNYFSRPVVTTSLDVDVLMEVTSRSWLTTHLVDRQSPNTRSNLLTNNRDAKIRCHHETAVAVHAETVWAMIVGRVTGDRICHSKLRWSNGMHGLRGLRV
jgi:hypothetical protein